MKRCLLLVCLALTACGSTQTGLESKPPTSAPSVAGTAVDPDNTDSIRHGDQLKAYPVGRYQDPNDPNVMHEAHTVYRSEETSRWNFSPNAPTAVPLGPTTAVSDPARQTTALSGELEQKIQQQNQLLQATYEQNTRMDEEIKKLQEENSQANQIIAANAGLQQELATRTTELQKMKQREASESEARRKEAARPWWEKLWNHFRP